MVCFRTKLAAGQLVWNGLNFGQFRSSHDRLWLLAVGAGVGEGEFVNPARRSSTV